MKDQDFDRLRKTIALGPEKRKLFLEQVEKDVALLEQLGIMDYSLLVGIHDCRRLQQVRVGRSLLSEVSDHYIYNPAGTLAFNGVSTQSSR